MYISKLAIKAHPSMRVNLPSQQHITKNNVNNDNNGISIFDIVLSHLNGAIIPAIPSPNVRLVKLLPRILPIDISGCCSIIPINADIQSGAAVPIDTRNIPASALLIFNNDDSLIAASHNIFAPNVNIKNPTNRAEIVINTSTCCCHFIKIF